MIVTKEKAFFRVQLGPFSVWEVFFGSYFFVGRAAAFFSSASWCWWWRQGKDLVLAGRKGKFLSAFVPCPTFFTFLLSPQPLPPTTEILLTGWFSVVTNSKVCRGRPRNSSLLESQSYFVSEQPFFLESKSNCWSLNHVSIISWTSQKSSKSS